MKYVEYVREKITLKDFEDKLNMKFKKIELRDNHLKLSLLNKNAAVYLRCSDIKQLFGFNFNLFDKSVSVKDNVLSREVDIEMYKGDMKKWLKIQRK
jgi:hypothetical protein